MVRHPLCAGGFLWVFADEGIKRTDKDGKIDINGNKAPDGIVGPYREKEASYFTIKEIWSPVYLDEKFLTPSFTGKLKVENRYDFTNLNQCTFSWKLVSYPGAGSTTTDYKVNATGKPKPLSLAPGENGLLNLDLPASWRESDALFLTAYDPYKRELFTWSWPLKSAAEIAAREIKTIDRASKVEATEQNDRLIIKVDGITYHFDKATGNLAQVVNAKSAISLSGGPVVAGVDHKLKEIKQGRDGETYWLEPIYEGDKENSFQVKWTFTPGKPVKLDYNYAQKGVADFMGITFNYPEANITGMKWLGRGPNHVWKNRLRGLQFNVWQKNYNNAITGEAWQYPEFKGYHAELYWVTVQTKEAPFTVYAANEGIFLQMLQPAKPLGAANNNTSPPFPAGNIGFLNAISPIGTKFQSASLMGPQSQKNAMLNNSPVKGELWFDFR
ncbi:hypothetical protein AAE02nite_13820 [Adhaeribacter aerolatus]|uniref:beta-galactosidase n=1 Tax=Adhaeribacter aerolatus TaxID=670289 RepID=A0A512AVI2_9BACT|nr:beta-galactosidase domain 4-containing protein [Adhaeribacter aerolatus]GEO03718.1 hypothetical protein AAE02nite_13820 [Adhaeribacter aerolatus]